MVLHSYWERSLNSGFGNEDTAKDYHDYYNHCFGVIYAGLGP